MATVYNNNPTPAENTGSSMGMIIGIIIVLAIIIVGAMFLWPRMNGDTTTPVGNTGTNSGVDTSGGGSGVTIPDQVDVNVNEGTAPQ